MADSIKTIGLLHATMTILLNIQSLQTTYPLDPEVEILCPPLVYATHLPSIRPLHNVHLTTRLLLWVLQIVQHLPGQLLAPILAASPSRNSKLLHLLHHSLTLRGYIQTVFPLYLRLQKALHNDCPHTQQSHHHYRPLHLHRRSVQKVMLPQVLHQVLLLHHVAHRLGPRVTEGTTGTY
jgi:hypothetical protein